MTMEDKAKVREALKFGRRAIDEEALPASEGSSILTQMWRTRLKAIDDALKLVEG